MFIYYTEVQLFSIIEAPSLHTCYCHFNTMSNHLGNAEEITPSGLLHRVVTARAEILATLHIGEEIRKDRPCLFHDRGPVPTSARSPNLIHNPAVYLLELLNSALACICNQLLPELLHGCVVNN